MDAQSALLLYKFVDLSSFLQAIADGRSKPEMTILMLLTTVIGLGLAVLLWKSAKGGKPAQSLAWAATITWTLLLNVYVPMYDSVLIVIAVVLSLEAAKELDSGAALDWIGSLSLMIFAVSWVTYDIARNYRIQLISVAIAILGLAQLYVLNLVLHKGIQRELSAIPEA
jgi:hypothetical protein